MTNKFILKNIQFDTSIFLKIAQSFAHTHGTCIFYSGGTYETSLYSYLALFPYEAIWVHGGKLHRERKGLSAKLLLLNPWDELRAALTADSNDSKFPEWVGFFCYELGWQSDVNREIPQGSRDFPSFLPEAYFQRCALILAVDHCTGEAHVQIADQGQHLLKGEEKQWVERLSEESAWEDLVHNMPDLKENNRPESPLVLAKPKETLNEYKTKISHAKELIYSGDIYQVNLSHPLHFRGERDPFAVFKKLTQINPSPFSAYLFLKNFAVVSASPERFLRKQEGWLETRPIKGTINRGKNSDEDKKNLEILLNSSKEQAELLMITDLMRNDLGKVSVPGTVFTTKIREVEAYQNVYHLLSIIKSKALPNLHSIDLIRACFPGGSITGCPKLRAMEVIAELEKRPRGIYTGSIGYFANNGDFDFNIAIRTLLFHGQEIDVQLGGAIVADSEAESEYQETMHKGASIFRALDVEHLVLETPGKK